MCLHFMGHESGHRLTANAFVRGETTIKKHTLAVAKAIIEVYGVNGPRSVMQLPSAGELQLMAQANCTARGLPQCAGSLDGKHFFVKYVISCLALCYTHTRSVSVIIQFPVRIPSS